jgi:exonuclease VII large subunit
VQHRDPAGGLAVLCSTADAAPGEELRIRLADGTLGATVTERAAARHDGEHG